MMDLNIGLLNAFNKVRYVICIGAFIGLGISNTTAQSTFSFSALADFEYAKAGSKSHYYYNEIDKDAIDGSFSIAQLNLMGRVNINKQWILNARVLLERDKGQKVDNFAIPQLNIQWVSKKRKVGITVGSFTNPFGAFNQKQLSTQRNFIGLPLAYGYYNNISSNIGFVEDMGDIAKIAIDGEVQWGSTNLYYGGYTTGAMFSWNIFPGKVNWKIALVNGASNLQKQLSGPLQYGVISRLKIRPTYFWEQGFSVSHGTFYQSSEVSDQLDEIVNFKQSMLGMDFKLGKGYFEFTGEVIGSFYKVPQFNEDGLAFEVNTINAPLSLSNLAVNLDIKYELPFIQGSYIAYRIDHLRYSKLENSSTQKWDNNVLRHSFAIGYHINQYILTRATVSTQQVDNKEWDKKLGTFRLMLTAHF
ncbi:MAG: hypothetical protein ACI9P5_001803 [Saprospiraceae bacterium]|jgi:hypothetical protein|tara:strand:- start:3665 stop:4912 length:1248 start_codon:yes stop_codon:yes gene_type:complete